MKPTILITAAALALGLVAGCDRKADDRASVTTPATTTPPPAASGSSAPTTPQVNTPTTPANVQGKTEKNPVQQQVDPKEQAQRRDFQHKGDGAGPRSTETAPKSSGG
jgi:hypothetical protein